MPPLGWAPGVASAQVDSHETAEIEKAYWQDRYRRLRKEAARLRREIEEARTAYAAANRRNYRRGPVRHEYRAKMLEAEKELSRVEAELSTLHDEARRAGALPGWLREVEMEPVGAEEKPDEGNPTPGDESDVP
ncbi:MAG TPA: hypothetical protein ENI85_10995 [Deltaproteobacteria bacterium]|nr:hypothetical protein [Deltaproteobacteria bacterium]